MFPQDQNLDISLGKRRLEYDCTLNLYIPLEKEYATEGYGQLMLGSSQGENYLLFTFSDGSEVCWTIEKSKKFARVGSDGIRFESPAERKIRTLKFTDAQKAAQVWDGISQALSNGAYINYPPVAPSPTSERSALSQACAATAVESMSSTFITDNNIDIVIGMLKDRPTAASELFRTAEQVAALHDTFDKVRYPTVRWPEMIKLGELLRKVLTAIDLPCQYLLIGNVHNFKLLVEILTQSDGVEENVVLPTSLEVVDCELARLVVGNQSSCTERIMVARRMAFMREQVLDATLDFPTRKSLGVLLADHLAYIFENILHQRNASAVGRWVALIRKGCVQSLQTLKEIVGYLARKDIQVGGAATRQAFATFFKDWRIGSYLASLLHKVRLKIHSLQNQPSLCPHANVLAKLPAWSSHNGWRSGDLSGEFLQQQVLQRLTLEILSNLAETAPQLLWDELSSKSFSETIPDLMCELTRDCCKGSDSHSEEMRTMVIQMWKVLLKPMGPRVPESYNRFLLRVFQELLPSLVSQNYLWFDSLNLNLAEGLLAAVTMSNKNIEVSSLTQQLSLLREHLLDSLRSRLTQDHKKCNLVNGWQVLKVCIKLLTALKRRGSTLSQDVLFDQGELALFTNSWSQAVSELQSTLETLIVEVLQSTLRQKRILRRGGLLSGVIADSLMNLVIGQELQSIAKVLEAFPEQVLPDSNIFAVLRSFVSLVTESGLSPTEASDRVLNRNLKNSVIQGIQDSSEDKSVDLLFGPEANYPQSSTIDKGILANVPQLFSSSSPLKVNLESTNGVGLAWPLRDEEKELSGPVVWRALESIGASRNFSPLKNPPRSQEVSPQTSESSRTENSQSEQQAVQNGRQNKSNHLTNDVDLLDFESTEDGRLESLVLQKSPSNMSFSRLGSRRTSVVMLAGSSGKPTISAINTESVILDSRSEMVEE